MLHTTFIEEKALVEKMFFWGFFFFIERFCFLIHSNVGWWKVIWLQIFGSSLFEEFNS